MDRWDIVTLAPAIYAACLSTLVFRRQRRQNRDVFWTVTVGEPQRPIGRRRVEVTNKGIGKARSVTVELEPTPRGLGNPGEPEDVDLGGKVFVEFVRQMAEPPPQRITVHWRNRLGLRKSWSTRV